MLCQYGFRVLPATHNMKRSWVYLLQDQPENVKRQLKQISHPATNKQRHLLSDPVHGENIY